MGTEGLIRLADVVKTYDTPAGSFPALKGVSLDVGGGEFVAVVGKSGSGKSTLVNMITGIDRPTSGEVWVEGTAVHALTESQTARWRGRSVGVVFQFFQLLPTISLLDNVILPMEFAGLYSARERRERAGRLLERVGLEQHADKLPSALSGGQQQRVAIARSLATDPPLIVADEPTGNLDSKTAEHTFELFDELVEAGKTVIIVTHDNDLAIRATRTVVVLDGQVVNEYVRQALAPLDIDALGVASARLRHETHEPGSVVVKQGEEAETFYIVIDGEVEVVLEYPTGQEIPVNTLGRGAYFGEMALLQGGMRRATVRAGRESGVEVMALDRETFVRLIDESEQARREFDRVMAERLEGLQAAG